MHVRQRLKQFSHKVVESLPKICYEPSTVSSELCLNPHLVVVQISPIKGQHKLIASGLVAVELSWVVTFTCCCLPAFNLHFLEISWLGSWLRGCGRTGALKGGDAAFGEQLWNLWNPKRGEKCIRGFTVQVTFNQTTPASLSLTSQVSLLGAIQGWHSELYWALACL